VPKAGPRKIEKYGDRFKATAVKLSSVPGVQVKDVAAALDIHPVHAVVVAKAGDGQVHAAHPWPTGHERTWR
jgi:transposase-like protein